MQGNGDDAVGMNQWLGATPLSGDGAGKIGRVCGGSVIFVVSHEVACRSLIGKHGDATLPGARGGGAFVADLQRGVIQPATERTSVFGGELREYGFAGFAESSGAVGSLRDSLSADEAERRRHKTVQGAEEASGYSQSRMSFRNCLCLRQLGITLMVSSRVMFAPWQSSEIFC